MATARKASLVLTLADFRKGHKLWVSQGRKLGKAFGKSYEPADFVVSLETVKDDFLVYLRAENEDDTLAFYDFYANPVTIASDLWHWFGRDVLEALKPRGWDRAPNALLGKPEENGMFSGARDILIKEPTALSPIEHKRIALEAKQAKRERALRLKENAENGLRRLEDDIRRLERWIDQEGR